MAQHQKAGDFKERAVQSPIHDALPPDTPNLFSGADPESPVRQVLSMSQEFGALSLNPNAAEFVPSFGSSGAGEAAAAGLGSATAGAKAAEGGMKRVGSTTSTGSDDDHRRLLRAQLPDELNFNEPPEQGLSELHGTSELYGTFSDPSLASSLEPMHGGQRLDGKGDSGSFGGSHAGRRVSFDQSMPHSRAVPYADRAQPGGPAMANAIMFRQQSQAGPSAFLDRSTDTLVPGEGRFLPGHVGSAPAQEQALQHLPNPGAPPFSPGHPGHAGPGTARLSTTGPAPRMGSEMSPGAPYGWGPEDYGNPPFFSPEKTVPADMQHLPAGMPPYGPAVQPLGGGVVGEPHMPPWGHMGPPPPGAFPQGPHPPPPMFWGNRGLAPGFGPGPNAHGDERAMFLPPEDPLQFLAMEFPGYSMDSLLEVFLANGSDMGRTLEMLTQLELQEGAARSPHRSGRPNQDPPPNQRPDFCRLCPSDFPAFDQSDSAQRAGDAGPTTGHCGHTGSEGIMAQPHATAGNNFAAAVRKHSGPGSGGALGAQPFRESLPLGNRSWQQGHGAPPAHVEGRGRGGGKEYPGAPPQAGAWLETGDAVGHMYGALRDEARDHARVRNAYFEQASKAYLSGNKALAKELSSKGQWHNEQMKAAHAKASETIFRERNIASGFLRRGPQAWGHEQDGARTLDLHGLHVGEALSVLKRELANMRSAQRASGQQQQVLVCVGTGHHTKGRTPARLPAAVETFLSEEGVHFSEAQPGLLRVVL